MRRVSPASIRSDLDIANSLHKAFTLEFAGSELKEISKLFALLDSGADVDMVTRSLVVELEKLGLVVQQKLASPFPLGAWGEDQPFAWITHFVTLPVRIGDSFFEHNFAVADVASPPHLILGRPWLAEHCPGALYILDSFGEGEASPPKPAPTTVISTRSITPVVTPALTPQRSSGAMSPINLGPSEDPFAAFSAGGVFAALEAEETRRAVAAEKYVSACTARIAIIHALETKQDIARIRAAAANPDDPGVRGLTGNKEGWLDTIPEPFRRFANTVFSDEGAAALPPHRPDIDCVVKIRDGEKLATSKIYDMSQEQLQVLKQLLDAELAKGFIRPSNSGSSAPVFFVRDPPSESRNQGQLRLVVDYRDLNSKIELDEYPIPLSRTVMARLPKAKVFTKFDVRSGFSNIRMAPGSEPATAFKTFFGLFEYQVMPMGLATAPSVFQRFINHVLAPFLEIFCFAYLDDIIIFSDSQREHGEHVRLILEALEKHKLHLKPGKCVWNTTEVSFLGFTAVAGKGLRMSDDKIQGIRNIPPPRGLHDLRSFLGTVNFYDKFIPHYSDLTAPLTALTKAGVPWEWSATCQSAFDRLLAAIRDDVFLAAFDPDKPIRLDTDASDVAYGGAIMQQDEHGHWRPIIFFHHKFKDGEKGWDGPDKELYAIVFAFKKYRHFLAQPRFPVEVYSDHRNLAKFMFTTNLLKSHDGRLGRWWSELSGCNFQIQYRTGVTNVVADFLSRYGYEDSAALDSNILLPASRFSSKALADIKSWFKSSPTSPNIRQLLEKRFSSSSSAPLRPRRSNSEKAPSPLPGSCSEACRLHCKNQNGSAHPVAPLSPALRSRFVPESLSARQARLLGRFAGNFLGSRLADILPRPGSCRSGGNRLGLGADL